MDLTAGIAPAPGSRGYQGVFARFKYCLYSILKVVYLSCIYINRRSQLQSLTRRYHGAVLFGLSSGRRFLRGFGVIFAIDRRRDAEGFLKALDEMRNIAETQFMCDAVHAPGGGFQ